MDFLIFMLGASSLLLWLSFYRNANSARHCAPSPGFFAVLWLFSGLALVFAGYVGMAT